MLVSLQHGKGTVITSTSQATPSLIPLYTWQFKQIHQVITADAYDEALRSTPELCPLTLVGDMRSGAQLLADAAADSAQTIESMVLSHAGRVGLQHLLERIQDRTTEMEARLAGLEAQP